VSGLRKGREWGVEMNRTQNTERRTQEAEAKDWSDGETVGLSDSGRLRRHGRTVAARREFLRGLMGIAVGACVGGIAAARYVSLRRVVMADPLGRYPGRVVPLGRVDFQAEWSG
jgi:hypothetical protein